jgi:hypothetical protein
LLRVLATLKHSALGFQEYARLTWAELVRCRSSASNFSFGPDEADLSNQSLAPSTANDSKRVCMFWGEERRRREIALFFFFLIILPLFYFLIQDEA